MKTWSRTTETTTTETTKTARTETNETRARDEHYLRLALAEARRAAEREEVPIGTVIVRSAGGHDELLAAAHNRVRADRDPTAHAEILALRAAACRAGAERLVGCEVFSTVEPCFMCAGALVQARVRRVVFALRDPKFGGCVSLGRVLDHPQANHRVEFEEGLLAEEARQLLQEFFRARRGRPQSGAAEAGSDAPEGAPEQAPEQEG